MGLLMFSIIILISLRKIELTCFGGSIWGKLGESGAMFGSWGFDYFASPRQHSQATPTVQLKPIESSIVVSGHIPQLIKNCPPQMYVIFVF
jgi:hypothetical protein